MDNTFSNSSSLGSSPLPNNGFSLIELMVAIAVVSILSAIALPSMNDLLVKMRVDNEISEMQRLLLTARNTAINTGKFTTVCPLVGGVCKKKWHRKISVFTNDTNTVANGKSFTGADELVKIKEIKNNGNGKFSIKSLGDLTITGVKKQISLDFTIDVTSGKISLKGEKKIKMTDFNIDPPKALFGTITTGDDLTIQFSTIFR